MAINGINSFLTKKLPSGVQEVGGKTTDLVKGQLKGASKGLLDEAKDAYSDLKSAVTGKASLGSAFPDDSRIPERKIGLKTEDGETNALPADYNPDLCFRMDFVEFNRSAGFADDGLPKKPEETLQIKPTGTFILPIPMAIGTSQGVNYSTTELSTAGSVENVLRTSNDNSRSALGSVGVGTLNTFSGAATEVYRGLLATNAGKLASMSLGFVPNPNLANIFSGVQMREFTFEFKIVPRSQEESKRALAMFQQIRKYMLPELQASKLNIMYPDEVVLSFSEQGSRLLKGGLSDNLTPLDNIFNFKRCVLQNVQLDVNSDGDQAFFTDYSPVEMKLSLSFKEQSIQTRTDYTGEPGVILTAGDVLSETANKAVQSKVKKPLGPSNIFAPGIY